MNLCMMTQTRTPMKTKANPGGGIPPLVGYTGRQRPKGVPFVSLQYTKG